MLIWFLSHHACSQPLVEPVHQTRNHIIFELRNLPCYVDVARCFQSTLVPDAVT